MTEANIQSLILRELTRDPSVRLFRNNSGIGWAGTLLRKTDDGTVVLGNARPLHAGLFRGSADLIGWRSGRFLSIEVKSETGRVTPAQLNWMFAARNAGGIAGIVRSVEEAEFLIANNQISP